MKYEPSPRHTALLGFFLAAVVIRFTDHEAIGLVLAILSHAIWTGQYR